MVADNMNNKKLTKISFIIFALFLLIFALYSAFAQTGTSNIFPIYKNESAIVPIFKNILINVEYSCYDNVSKNITCTRKEEREVFDHYENITTKSEIIAYSKDFRIISGFVNEENGIISKWNYDIKDRNIEEFGRCREYEKDKGVCDEY